MPEHSKVSSEDTLSCPSCRASMTRLAVDRHYGGQVALDLCKPCHGLWFDTGEHLQLAPMATLRLFEIIHESAADRRPVATRRECPRCRTRLLETHDQQRNTRFRYWRCPRGHGRFIAFFEFLREKDFVRPLDARQLAELRAAVQSVNCSNCGAPIDLATQSSCEYCHTPLAMLDFAQVGRMVKELTESETARPAPPERAARDAMLALALVRERRQVEASFSEFEQRHDWTSLMGGGGVIESGIAAVVHLLQRL
jgi:Zn-finger nucleic acid-binding protein